MSEQSFEGFSPPKQNWSKLPHQFIEALPMVKTIAEMKIILYILRHTWGYHDAEKKITLDEFRNGRKDKEGKRIDKGTGLSRNAIKAGIKAAINHGFIIVETDDHDKARVKNYYSLKSSEIGGQSLTPRGSDSDPQQSNIDPRTEKETIRKKPVKEKIAPPKNKQHNHPAIQAYRSAFERYPAKNTYADIIDKVGDNPADVEFWGQVCRAWKLSPWNPKNLAGMFDHFDRKQLPKTNGGINGTRRHSIQTTNGYRRTGADLEKDGSFNPYTRQTVAPKLPEL